MDEFITLKKNEHKMYEILSLLIYFYNKKYILYDLFNGYSDVNFTFRKIDKTRYLDMQSVFATDEYTIDVSVIDNDKRFYYDSKNSQLHTFFKFHDKNKYIKLEYNYDNDADLKFASIGYDLKLKRFYDVYNKKIGDDNQEKFIKGQNLLIEKYKFCEEYYETLLNNIYIKEELDSVYKLKKYIKSIIDFNPLAYENKNHVYDLLNFVENNVKEKQTVTMNKFLNIRKNTGYSVTLSIGSIIQKTFSLTTNDADNTFFNIFTPIFKQLGGLRELENIILKNRLMVE